MCNYMYTTYVCASLRGQNLDGFKFAEFLMQLCFALIAGESLCGIL